MSVGQRFTGVTLVATNHSQMMAWNCTFQYTAWRARPARYMGHNKDSKSADWTIP